ncbi:MAG: SpoIIE family protein phosphatase [Thermomicrobiales bacterium]
MVSSRNSHTPLLLWLDGGYELRPSESSAIGPRRHTKPAVNEFAAEPGLRIAIFSDGVVSAGERYGHPFDPLAFANESLSGDLTAQEMADALLAAALAADQGRANDDMTVVTLALGPRREYPHIRRMAVILPLA